MDIRNLLRLPPRRNWKHLGWLDTITDERHGFVQLTTAEVCVDLNSGEEKEFVKCRNWKHRSALHSAYFADGGHYAGLPRTRAS